MKNFWMIAAALFIVAACTKKDDPTLSGSESEPSFTYTIKKMPGGDTLPGVSVVTFTNTSVGAFSYLWNFGDATTTTQESPTKTYAVGKVYDVILRSVGPGGNKALFQRVAVERDCDFPQFEFLTGCTNRRWQVSPVSDAIVYYNADGSVALSNGPTACLSNDVFAFFSDGTYRYDAKGNTLLNGTCGDALPNSRKFFLLKNTGGNPKIVLSKDTNNAFLGTTDEVVDNTYEILAISENELTVEGTFANGKKVRVKLINGFDINTIKLLLTGGSTKEWRLDSTDGAKAVTAGLEANPAQYYSGGPLAVCQKNDIYTFGQDGTVAIEYGTDHLDPAQGFSCQPITNVSFPFTFGAVQGSVAGLAQVSLTPNTAVQWIGIKDRAPENVYRIISIENDKMVLRSGNGATPTSVVHEMKFVVK